MKLALFANCVIQGAKYPDLDWRERCAEIDRASPQALSGFASEGRIAPTKRFFARALLGKGRAGKEMVAWSPLEIGPVVLKYSSENWRIAQASR